MVRLQEALKNKGFNVSGGVNSNIRKIADEIKSKGDQLVSLWGGGK